MNNWNDELTPKVNLFEQGEGIYFRGFCMEFYCYFIIYIL